MLTVGNDEAEVERRLSEGRLECPVCAAPLRGWGHGRVTHVLLPAGMLARRADSAAVIGAALAGAAAGLGHRTLAARLGRAASTVRGWLRRLASRAEPLRSAFTALACALDADPLLPGPAGSPLADAVAAILAAAAAAARRWGAVASAVSPWELASAVTSGGLLCPGPAVQMINTSCPW